MFGMLLANFIIIIKYYDMKTFYKILGGLLIAIAISSCETEIVIGNDLDNRSILNQILNDQELWYVDLNNTQGNPDIPFMTCLLYTSPSPRDRG